MEPPANPPDATPMRGLSLRAKVFLMFAATSLLIVAPALLLIAQAVERGVYERAREELDGAGLNLRSQWDFRDELLATAAERWARDSDLSDAWQAGNLTRVRRILQQA